MADLSQQTINPWKHIFIHPKETIEWVIENNPERFYRRLFWVYVFSFLLGYLLNPYGSSGEITFSKHLIRKLISTPFVATLGSYFSIYFGTFICNFIASLFGGQAPFRTAKEVLLWISYPLTVITAGSLCWQFFIYNVLGLNLGLVELAFSILSVIYSTFIHANTFRALYQLSKLRGYLFASLITIPLFILMSFLAIIAHILYK